MNFVGKIVPNRYNSTSDLKIRMFTIGLQSGSYYRYYYGYYSLQAMVG